MLKLRVRVHLFVQYILRSVVMLLNRVLGKQIGKLYSFMIESLAPIAPWP